MKRTRWMAAAVVFVASAAIAAKPAVPDAVTDRATELFGKEVRVEVEQTSDAVVYELEAATELEVVLDANGRILALGVEIPVGLVPDRVLAAARQALPAEPQEAELVLKDGEVAYELEAEANGREVEILVAADGTVLGMEDDEEDEDGDENEDD